LAIQLLRRFGFGHRTPKPGIFDHSTIKTVHIWSSDCFAGRFSLTCTPRGSGTHLSVLPHSLSSLYLPAPLADGEAAALAVRAATFTPLLPCSLRRHPSPRRRSSSSSGGAAATARGGARAGELAAERGPLFPPLSRRASLSPPPPISYAERSSPSAPDRAGSSSAAPP